MCSINKWRESWRFVAFSFSVSLEAAGGWRGWNGGFVIIRKVEQSWRELNREVVLLRLSSSNIAALFCGFFRIVSLILVFPCRFSWFFGKSFFERKIGRFNGVLMWQWACFSCLAWISWKPEKNRLVFLYKNYFIKIQEKAPFRSADFRRFLAIFCWIVYKFLWKMAIFTYLRESLWEVRLMVDLRSSFHSPQYLL